MKPILLLLNIISVLFIANPVFAIVSVEGEIPAYDQHKFNGSCTLDCFPTAIGMVLGYWDSHGWPAMVPGGGPIYINNPQHVTWMVDSMSDLVGYECDDGTNLTKIWTSGADIELYIQALNPLSNFSIEYHSGFSFNDVKDEIDNGYPLILNMTDSATYRSIEYGSTGYTDIFHSISISGYAETKLFDDSSSTEWLIGHLGFDDGGTVVAIEWSTILDVGVITVHPGGTPAADDDDLFEDNDRAIDSAPISMNSFSANLIWRDEEFFVGILEADETYEFEINSSSEVILNISLYDFDSLQNTIGNVVFTHNNQINDKAEFTTTTGGSYYVRVSLLEGTSPSPYYLAVRKKTVIPETHSLNVQINGSGGKVTGPSGINCTTGVCSTIFTEGDNITLLTETDPGYTFDGWSGGGCTGTEKCETIINEDVTITAFFSVVTPSNYLLSVTKYGDGSGTITSNLGDINCGGQCQDRYVAGSDIILTMDEDYGSDFRGWGGDCTGNDNLRSCTVTMDKDVNVAAAFGLESDDPCYDWSWVAGNENSASTFEDIKYGEICANNWHENDIDNDGYVERYLLVGKTYTMWSRAQANAATDSYIDKVLVDDLVKDCFDNGTCGEQVERVKYSSTYGSPSNSIHQPKIDWYAINGSTGEWFHRFSDADTLKLCWDINENEELCDSGDHIENYLVLWCGQDSDCDTDYYCKKNTLSDPMTYSCSLREQVMTASFSHMSGTYDQFQDVMIYSGTEGATIRYTMDGSTPTSTHGDIYTEPIKITGNTTLKAIAFKSGMRNSAVSAAVFTIQPVAAPSFRPAQGVYFSFQYVTISTPTEGAQIYYTTDESIPTPDNGILYTDLIEIRRTGAILKARAFKDQALVSNTVSATYDLQMQESEVPQISPPGGTYNWDQIVTITTTGNELIRYTIDGSTPTHEHGAIYSEPINLISTTDLKAIAHKDGYQDSTVASVFFSIIKGQVAPPTFSVEGGQYTSTQNVAITSDTEGATIHFTNDGSMPGSTHGYMYTSPVSITANTLLKAVATKDMTIDSVVTSAEYEIDFLPGDVNGSGKIDLADIIVILKLLTGSIDNFFVTKTADVNNDGIISWDELIYDLEDIAGFHLPLTVDDFSLGLHLWKPFGSPFPEVKESVDTFSTFVVDISADSDAYNGGVYSRQSVDLSNGGIIEADYRLLDLSSLGCLTEVNIALAGNNLPITDTYNWSESSLLWNINHIGRDCSLYDIDYQFREHNWFNFSVLSETNSQDRSSPYSISGDLYGWGWYRAKIKIRPDRIVEFYIEYLGVGEPTLLWTSRVPITSEYLEGKRLVIGGSYSGYSDSKVNNVYFDNIYVHEFSVAYRETFDEDPGFQSQSTENTYWDSTSGEFYINTNGSADDWVYSPDFGTVYTSDSFSINLDVKYEVQNEIGPPVIHFFENEPICDPNCPYESSFQIAMMPPATDPDSIDRVLTIGGLETITPNMNTWYHISIEFNEGHLHINISDRETNTDLFDEDQWDYQAEINDFSFLAVGGKQPQVLNRSSMRIDNISIIQ